VRKGVVWSRSPPAAQRSLATPMCQRWSLSTWTRPSVASRWKGGDADQFPRHVARVLRGRHAGSQSPRTPANRSSSPRPARTTGRVSSAASPLGDGARGDLVAELGQFGGDDLLTPGRILAPHPPDEFAEICINGVTARRTVGARAPEEAPSGPVPADEGLWFHEQHDVHEAVEAAGQGTDEPAIESAQSRAFDLAADDDKLLAKEQVLGDQGCAGRDEGQDEVEQEAKEADHGSDRVPRWSVPGTAGVRAGHTVVGRGWRSPIGCRTGIVTVGDTG
jgi:hypothetical protein